MQLKKIIPACLALVVLCGCSSSSTSSKKDEKTNDNTAASETVDTKDLTTVKGTMNVPEDFKDSNLEGSTVEYTVDKDGYVHTLNFHQVSALVPYDGDKIAESNGKELHYVDENNISKWKETEQKDASVNKKGYSISLTIGDKLSENVAEQILGDTNGYLATYDYSLDSSKASTASIKECAENLDLKTKNGKITEKSLKKMLEVYYMTYTN